MTGVPTKAPTPRGSPRPALGDLLAWTLAGSALAATTASLLGRLDWRLSLLSHFRLHLTAGCLALLPPLEVLGHRGPALATATALAANLGDIVRREAARPAPAPPTTGAAGAGAAATLISFNLLQHNPHKAPALAWLAAQAADAVVLVEVTPDWWEALARHLAGLYPHRADGPDSHGSRILVLSRHPLRLLGRAALDDQGLLAVEVLKPELRFTLFAIHPDHALERRGLAPQRAFLERLAQCVRRIDGPVAVAGDVNTSPWSAAFHRFLERTGLDAPLLRRGTFPAALSWAGLPIDHVFVGHGLELAALDPGPDLGSDHRPVRARLRRR